MPAIEEYAPHKSREEWLANLKPGDEVYYNRLSGASYRTRGNVSEVEKITATGMIRLKDGELFTKEGKGRGRNCDLQPYTAEDKAKVARRARVRDVQSDCSTVYRQGKDLQQLTEEELTQLEELLKKAVGE